MRKIQKGSRGEPDSGFQAKLVAILWEIRQRFRARSLGKNAIGFRKPRLILTGDVGCGQRKSGQAVGKIRHSFGNIDVVLGKSATAWLLGN